MQLVRRQSAQSSFKGAADPSFRTYVRVDSSSDVSGGRIEVLMSPCVLRACFGHAGIPCVLCAVAAKCWRICGPCLLLWVSAKKYFLNGIPSWFYRGYLCNQFDSRCKLEPLNTCLVGTVCVLLDAFVHKLLPTPPGVPRICGSTRRASELLFSTLCSVVRLAAHTC